MSKEKVIRVVVEMRYSMADGSSPEGICSTSMAENIENELEELRASGNLTPCDISAEDLTCSVLGEEIN